MTTLRLIPTLGMACVVLAACSAHKNGSGNTVQIFDVNQRVPAPNIQGQALTGGVINLRDYVGRVVVLNIWGSWCGPCRTEQTKLNTVYNAEHRKGVEFIGVDIRDDVTSARAFTRTHDVRYPSIVDESVSVALDFNPRLPADPPITVVIDKAGRVAAKILGPADIGVLKPLVEQFAAEAS